MDFEQIAAAIEANRKGPHSPESVVAAARALTATVAYLGHATEHGEHLESVATVQAVLTELRATARSLDPVIKHVALATDDHADDPQVHDRRGGQHVGAETASAVLTELGKARDAGADLAQALDYAWSYARHLERRHG